MNELLMSIKTKYANEIFSGIKKYEFRKKSIGENNLKKKIYIYSSGIEKAIIGYITIDKILQGSIDYILKETDCYNNTDVINYFKDVKVCYALHIKENHKFNNPIKIEYIKRKKNTFNIPEYYRYIKNDELSLLKE